jgi:hypothetical protein
VISATPYKTQTWLVFVLGACHKAGLLPLEKKIFHQLIFLSNCLAPLFEEVPASARIVKYRRGPFYPLVQWDLDRLAAVGVIDVSDVRYENDEFGAWMEARYSINERTLKIIQTCRKIRYGYRLDEYLTEVSFAFASLNKRHLENVVWKDKTFDAPGASEGAFIDFSDDQNNRSLQAAEAFSRILPEEVAPSRKEELFLYLRFLERLSDQKKVA